MAVRPARIVICATALFLGGCFSAHLMDSGLSDTLSLQREVVEEFENPATLESKWRPISGWWSVKKGHLVQSKPWSSPLPGSFQMIHVAEVVSGGYAVETRFSFVKEGERAAGILLRCRDSDNFYLLRVRRYPNWQDNIDLVQFIDGERREDLQRMDLTVRPGNWYTLRAEDHGDEIVAFLDGAEIFRFPTEDPPMGTVGLAAKGSKIHFERFAASLITPAPDRRDIESANSEPPAGPGSMGPLADAR